MCINVHVFFVKGAVQPLFLVYLSVILCVSFVFLSCQIMSFFVSVVLLSSFGAFPLHGTVRHGSVRFGSVCISTAV